MAMWSRALKHAFTSSAEARRCFPATELARLERRIQESEQEHAGQLRFVIESSLHWRDALAGMGARERALQWFGQLRVWDTEHNCGVLVYLLLAERKIEIVADRSIARRVPAAAWQEVCDVMGRAFVAENHVAGLEEGLWRLHALLVRYAPQHGVLPGDELPNTVIVR